MQFQASEIADLMMMLVLGPIVVVIARRITPALFGTVALCIGLMLSGYVATIVEGIAFPDFFNLLEHASYALAGVAFVWLTVLVGRRVAESGSVADE